MATTLRHRLERDGVPRGVNLTESFCLYGTPLPSLTKKDRNEYKPPWEQEVYDEKGRRRFHGAFTGGWSAGYFNTVGSKEGWTPSSFRSSRTSRASATASRPEDFMDAEDLAEYGIQTRDAYASTHEEPADPFMRMAVPEASVSRMGQSLLQRMGWKPGQGIGPLVTYDQRRYLDRLLARLHLAPRGTLDDDDEARRHKFPPPDTQPLRPPAPARANALQAALDRYHAPAIGAAGLDSDEEDHVYGEAPPTVLGDVPPPAAARTSAAPHEGRATWSDGRPLPPGFVLAPPVSGPAAAVAWPQVDVPPDWTPDPRRVWTADEPQDAKGPLGAEDRRAMLGEAQHPGPPPALSAYLPGRARLVVHALDRATAQRALAAFRPTGADRAKDERYRAYVCSFLDGPAYVPPNVPRAAQQDEVDEFFQSACRHRPVHGDMAHRFTTGSSLDSTLTEAPAVPDAVQYARRGEFGPHTRHVERFDPPQLLCKRHGVPYPHPEKDGEEIPEELASPSPPSSPVELPEAEVEPIPPRPPKDLFQAVFGDEEEEDDPAPVTTTMPTAPHTKRPQKKRQRRMGPLTFRMDDDDDDP